MGPLAIVVVAVLFVSLAFFVVFVVQPLIHLFLLYRAFRECDCSQDVVVDAKGDLVSSRGQSGPHQIPPVIHQMSDMFEEPPSDIVLLEQYKSATSWKETHPTWNYVRWNATSIRDLISHEYPWFLDQYDSYKYGVQRVDVGRYFVLYHHGGLYADLDIKCVHSFEPLRRFETVLPKTTPVGLSNDLMMSTPHNPYFLQVIVSLASHNKWYFVPYLTVLFSTGSLFMSQVFCEFRGRDRIALIGEGIYGPRDKWISHFPGGGWHQWDASLWINGFSIISNHLLTLGVAVIALGGLCIWCARSRSRGPTPRYELVEMDEADK